MKELKITPPEGYEIDIKNSTFNCIKFKQITEKFRNNVNIDVDGWFITTAATIRYVDKIHNIETSYNVFATEKQAKSALAMAQISQIMANDKRFGGIVTDEEWYSGNITKYIITRKENNIVNFWSATTYEFLAFHTAEQRDLFLKENEDLVRDYLML